ncbi:tetratricopeptide repeat protein [Aureitalea marina]|uniref:Ion channel protein n=1 Tax=Aureitalea marina TaxID=930804 RepID=A0A2S7KRU2_9FLAO|nr:tetratricopeptide repeat protein [Aureitalea marina]PQB05330.1 ion channel protein [Aureitalea marina]
MRTFLTILFGVFTIYGSLAQNETLFEQGKQHYRDQEFAEALGKWNEILNDGQHSTALYFNMANAHYKLNQVGMSIYFYEKALQLDPTNVDVRNNLSYAQNATVDVIEPLPRTLFQRWSDDLSGLFSLSGWATLTVLFGFLTALFFVLYYFSSRERSKRILFAGSLGSLGLTIFALLISFMVESKASKVNPAIVVSERTDIQSEPSLGSEQSFILHEGTKVQILDQEGDWYRIQIADGKDGWLFKDAIKRL